jgi:hypothetical protein
MDTAFNGPEILYSTANPYAGGQAFEANSGNGPAYGPDDAVLANVDHVFTLTGNPVNSVPEPETYAMLLAGLGLMGCVGRRRKQNNTVAS